MSQSAFSTGAGVATVKTLDDLNGQLQAWGLSVSALLGSTAHSIKLHLAQRRCRPVDHHDRHEPPPALSPRFPTPPRRRRAPASSSSTTPFSDRIRRPPRTLRFNGVNLLNGDQLKLVFNETGMSTLIIAGVTDDPTGLGPSTLKAGFRRGSGQQPGAVDPSVDRRRPGPSPTDRNGARSSCSSNLAPNDESESG